MQLRHPKLLGLITALTTLSAFASDIPRPGENPAGLSVFERDLVTNTIRDAKGNRIRLKTKAASNANEAPDLWSQLDLTDDAIPGTSTERTYKTLTLKTPAQPIIVAVIDSGVDIKHPDLAGMIWENPKEAAGLPGVDDDRDGYVDNINGWNFLGNKNGQNVGSSNLEVTRELRRMRAIPSKHLTRKGRKYLLELEKAYGEQKDSTDKVVAKYGKLQADYLAAFEVLKELGLTEETVEAVKALSTKTADQIAAQTLMIEQLEKERDSKVFKEILDYYNSVLAFHLNLNFDSSAIVGDNPKDMNERFYGNNDVKAIGSDHGTHCAGIIGALRGNGIGPDGQSNYLKIMPIRAVPDGDERDKDVANGIRFAVDHGARVISMSFGKDFSPGKAYVDAAVKYAASKNVLIVHAAGNEAADLEKTTNFPTSKFLAGKRATNWIEVGASTKHPDEKLPADFSNYGKTLVDLFAPGEDIYSTTPDGTYSVFSGTSMATPEVAGIAALVLSQKPVLTAAQLKEILTSTVTTFPSLKVNLPQDGATGTPKQVSFSALSSTGGVVNALNALKAL